MAYLLYKYIKGKRQARNNRESVERPSEHQLHMSQKSEAPLQLPPFHERQHDTESGIEGISSQQDMRDKTQIKGQAKVDSTAPDSTSKEEERAARRYRWKLIAGLTLPFSVQALDATIIAGALPFIASDFSRSPNNFLFEIFSHCATG